MSDNKIPTLVRVKRVAYFMENEEKYTAKFTGAVLEAGKKGDKFPAEIVNVAIAINEAGLDACKLNRAAVQAWADHVVLGAAAPAGAPATEVAATEEASESPATAAEAVPAEKPAATIKPSVKPDNKSAAIETLSTASAPIPIRLSIYTLMLSAYELTKFDTQPDAAELRTAIEALAVKYGASLKISNNTSLIS